MSNEIVTLKTNRTELFGIECLWPGVGDIILSENGEAKVERAGAEALIASGHSHFFIVEDEGKTAAAEEVEEIKTKSEEDELSSSEEELSTEVPDELSKAEDETANHAVAGEELSEEEKAVYIASLETKTRKELEDACKPFPGTEWRGKNKEQLIAYLTEKIG